MTRLGYQIPNFTYPDSNPSEIFDGKSSVKKLFSNALER